MEFYELLEKAVGFIPQQYEGLRNGAEIFLSVFFIVCAAATCFFGHRVHKLWNMFFFFWIGFLVPVLSVDLIFDLHGALYYLLIIFGAVCGVLCAVYSKKLYRVQLFVTSFLMIFIPLPSYLGFLGGAGSVIAGFVCSIAVAVLSLRYKYIMLIINTSFSGALLLWNLIGGNFGLDDVLVTVAAIVTAFAGLVVQCRVEHEELTETYSHIKETAGKIKKSKKDGTENK